MQITSDFGRFCKQITTGLLVISINFSKQIWSTWKQHPFDTQFWYSHNDFRRRSLISTNINNINIKDNETKGFARRQLYKINAANDIKIDFPNRFRNNDFPTTCSCSFETMFETIFETILNVCNLCTLSWRFVCRFAWFIPFPSFLSVFQRMG